MTLALNAPFEFGDDGADPARGAGTRQLLRFGDPALVSKTAVTVKASLFPSELKLQSTLFLDMKVTCLPLGSSGKVSLP